MPDGGSDLPRAIGRPATRALVLAGYRDVQSLTRIPESELLRLHGVGPKAIRILREELAARGQSFAR